MLKKERELENILFKLTDRESKIVERKDQKQTQKRLFGRNDDRKENKRKENEMKWKTISRDWKRRNEGSRQT